MNNKKRIPKKSLLLIISSAVLVLSLVGMTIAFIIDKTDPITNIFKPSRVSCSVIEENWTDGNTVKENVKILNTGDTDAYIRSAIVVTWQNENGEVLGVAPALGTDYTISLNTTDWALGNDGYYYHKSAVEDGTNSAVLINSCEVTAEAPTAGYTLSVEILASAVQSEPDTAVNDAWGVTVNNDGTITPAN